MKPDAIQIEMEIIRMEREAALRAQLPPQSGSPVLPHGAGQRTTPKGELRAERRLPAEPDGGPVPRRRSPVGRWYADELLGWSREGVDHGLTFESWRRSAA